MDSTPNDNDYPVDLPATEATTDDELDPETLPAPLAAPSYKPMILQDDPEALCELVEKQAQYAERLIKARNALVRLFTFEKDWTVFGTGDKAIACLSAAGALRIMDKGNFPIQFGDDIKYKKEWITDSNGDVDGYRYIYEGTASLGHRRVFSIGVYSTKEAFFSKANGEAKDWRELNENHIQTAAHTYFKGNVVKDLLGLDKLPLQEFEAIGLRANRPNAGNRVEFSDKLDSLAAKDAEEMRQELIEILTNMGKAGVYIHADIDIPKKKVSNPLMRAQAPCEAGVLAVRSLENLTSFFGNKGSVVSGCTDFSLLKDKRLKYALLKARKAFVEFEKKQGRN